MKSYHLKATQKKVQKPTPYLAKILLCAYILLVPECH